MASRQSGRPPVIVLLTDSIDHGQRKDGDTPLALKELHGKTLIDHWWSTLEALGLNLQTHLFIATNAVNYKFFEFWAFSKGIPATHVINSGRSLGDLRVDWRTISRAINVAGRRIARDESASSEQPHDALIIAADTVPPHSGAAFQGSLAALMRSGRSTVLLQPPHGADGPGPLVSATPGAAPGYAVVARTAPAPGDAGAAHVVSAVLSGPAATLDFPLVASSEYSCVPLVAFLSADALASVASNAVLRGIAAARVAAKHGALPTEEFTADDDGDADASAAIDHHTTSQSFEAQSGVWLEDVLHRLAGTTGLTGLRISDKFQVGANDGSERGIPAVVTAAAAGEASPAVAAASPMSHTSSLFAHAVIHARAYGRVGLCGNPSDGYGGKTLSVTIANFFADAWLTPSAGSTITLVPHPLYDPSSFLSLRQLSAVSSRDGYSGGTRLLMALLHRFFLHVRTRGVELADRGFSLRYHTIVPRQVGLAGSSAILTAVLRAVLRFYGFGTEEKAAAIGLSRDALPAFVLSVESDELGIAAGLQDRVVQSYEGAVHMDFKPALIAERGFGRYTRIPTSALPPLFLAWAADPSDSGRIHAPVKQRWLAGDPEIVASMTAVGEVADAGHALAQARPYGAGASVAEREAIAHEWAALFSRNFALRLGMFGAAALGEDNLAMVGIARDLGAAAKFPGSGGAVVGVVDVAGMAAAGSLGGGVLPEGPGATAAARVAAASVALMEAYHARGYVYVRLQPHEPLLEA